MRTTLRMIVALLVASLFCAAAFTVPADPGPCLAAEPARHVAFKKVQLDSAFRAEGATVGDFNGDGKLDIAAGSVYYAAPDWTMVPILDEPKQFPVKGYSDAFLCFAADCNRDGRMDLIVCDWPGKQTWWFENSGKQGAAWTRHEAVAVTNGENPQWLDVDGDQCPELVAGVPQMGFARPDTDPLAPWKTVIVAGPNSPQIGRYQHGQGVGDINGDGRADIVIPQGWWEAAANREATPWTFHPANLGGNCAHMMIYDYDGDGDADVLSSSAHNYGIWWHEQAPNGWKLHEIDRSFSQTHALVLADIDRDGLMDFVTGKRWYAHNGNDPGAEEPALVCWYRLERTADGPQWTRHVIDQESGVGLHFEVVDINRDGRLDIAAANKRGVFYFQQTAPVKALP